MKQIIRRVAALVIGLGLSAVALAGLETVTHISDLNASWPLGSDLASTSDDHIRNIKSALKTDFPNFNGTYTSAAAPVFAIPNDTNTGMYGPSADNLAWATGGTQRALVNSTGNWTFNVASSGTTLTANVISGATGVVFGKTKIGDDILATGADLFSTTDVLSIGTTGAAATNLYTNNAARLQVASAGNVTINAPVSGTTLTANVISGASGIIFGKTKIGDDFLATGADLFSTTDVMSIGTSGAAATNLYTNSAARLQIASAGNVTINAPASGTTLTASVISGSTGIVFGKTKFGDDVLATGAGAFSSSTDPFNFGTLGSAASTWYTNATARLQVSSSGASIQGYGPVNTGLVDMTPDTSTFTATYTGFTAGTTCTATWSRVGKLVTLFFCAATGTSNATSFTMTGLPSAIQPAGLTQTVPLPIGPIQNGGLVDTTVSATVTAASGTVTFLHNGSASGWTSSSTKGFSSGATISYLLN